MPLRCGFRSRLATPELVVPVLPNGPGAQERDCPNDMALISSTALWEPRSPVTILCPIRTGSISDFSRSATQYSTPEGSTPSSPKVAQPGRSQPGFRDIATGDNRSYQASAGWDACTGLGSPTALPSRRP
jgi:hypothetical protein